MAAIIYCDINLKTHIMLNKANADKGLAITQKLHVISWPKSCGKMPALSQSPENGQLPPPHSLPIFFSEGPWTWNMKAICIRTPKKTRQTRQNTQISFAAKILCEVMRILEQTTWAVAISVFKQFTDSFVLKTPASIWFSNRRSTHMALI